MFCYIGQSPVHPPSPLAMMESSPSSTRPKLPRHRPLNRTQSAPLPQSTLAQLVIQQQHQNFLEKQKQYQQQVHINKVQSFNRPVVILMLSWEDEDVAEWLCCHPKAHFPWNTI